MSFVKWFGASNEDGRVVSDNGPPTSIGELLVDVIGLSELFCLRKSNEWVKNISSN